LLPYTDASMISAEELHTQFKQIHQSGVCWNHNEYEIGYASVAAPIFNKYGDVVGAPAIGAPIFRIRDAAHEKELEQLVCEAAQQISHRLQ
ncbi:MAG: IclR family transcriptional regulator domain-containing protein, partial [Candidatus Promineifilaceae bacterium]